jgi:hypothetical protein
MMKHLVKSAALALGLALSMSGAAFADGSYVGPNGGTASWDGDCYGGPYRAACHRSWTATAPNGNTYTGGTTVWGGPWSAGVSRHVTGPGGTAYYRRAYRRW